MILYLPHPSILPPLRYVLWSMITVIAHYLYNSLYHKWLH